MDRGCHAISPTQKGRTVGSAGGKEYYSRPPARVGGGFYSLGRSFFRFSEEKLRGSNTLSIRTPAQWVTLASHTPNIANYAPLAHHTDFPTSRGGTFCLAPWGSRRVRAMNLARRRDLVRTCDRTIYSPPRTTWIRTSGFYTVWPCGQSPGERLSVGLD
jgi:hypothetical protein